MEELTAIIVAMDETREPLLVPKYRQRISERYEIWYYEKNKLPPLSISAYSYSAIPKCYGLCTSTDLEISGILKLQKQPTLSLMGQGVFVAIIDTGIQYQDRAFRTNNGKSRIFSIWDQTIESKVEGENSFILYGQTFSQTEINEALEQENPTDIVPTQDLNGHGTFLASVACGTADEQGDFTGAAPESELIVVKLREAAADLYDYYAIPNDAAAYAESDIMAGIAYAENIAQKENRPLVILLGLGCNHGGHVGTGPLCEYLDSIASTRHRAVVCASGNEGNSRHHYLGYANNSAIPEKIEINVEKDISGVWVELWVQAPEQLAVSVASPTGELAPKREPFQGENGQYQFLFEGTKLYIDYISAGKKRKDQLIYLRFINLTKGLWTIRVYPQNAITGLFQAWLPMRQLVMGDVFFLESNPDTTLTSPSDASIPMTVGGYHSRTGAFYFESGRGPDATGLIKPDFVAPAVEIQGKGLRNNYVTYTGTSVAAAITAGACAQVLEWAVVRKNALGINSVDIKNLFCRGARRDIDTEYPSNTLGYGELDIYASFDRLRR